ncbi:DUF4267 domain-containing protein [Fluviicola sp.]|uniref:DUF4267 domain-containing protein n=1 Tax=Fluviicola sp. TaxID=1917219 RepID=UPI0031D465F6
MTRKIAISFAVLVGLGMIFLGARFLLSPEAAEAGFGIRFNDRGDYSFHYTKGIRDIFSGVVLCLLILTKQIKALGITLLVGTIIPVIDVLIVWSKDYTGIAEAMPHISAIIICLVSGILLLISKPSNQSL